MQKKVKKKWKKWKKNLKLHENPFRSSLGWTHFCWRGLLFLPLGKTFHFETLFAKQQGAGFRQLFTIHRVSGIPALPSPREQIWAARGKFVGTSLEPVKETAHGRVQPRMKPSTLVAFFSNKTDKNINKNSLHTFSEKKCHKKSNKNIDIMPHQRESVVQTYMDGLPSFTHLFCIT